ncbi:hypothetical protein DL770_007953 [Monosporascus sp. CRB-9-2]|nr:hypothetical protein DL770_007953 [Monosporascus sp. CRB-9-2]
MDNMLNQLGVAGDGLAANLNNTDGKNWKEVRAQAGVLLDGFSYPAEKKRSAETVAQLQRTEWMAKQFWRPLCDRLSEGGAISNETKLLLRSTTTNRTPDYDPSREERPRKGRDKSQELERPFGALSISQDTQQSFSSSYSTPAPKIKVKTRGEAQSPRGEDRSPERRDAPGERKKIELNRRAYRTMRLLLGDTAGGSHPGEVPWRDFLHLMSSMDFEVQKLRGSVWHFIPPESERSINFHEPHPRPKLEWKVARWYGRRLARVYNYILDSFVQKGP